MWSDNETDVDLLDFSHLVAAVISVVKNKELFPATIGVFGDWGSGKSSLMKMLRAELEGEGSILCLEFNGWLFEGYEDTKTALMGTVLREISERQKLGKTAERILGSLVRRINWMRIAASLGKYAFAYGMAGETGVGLAALLDVSSITQALTDRFKDIETEDIEKTLDEVMGEAKDESMHLSIREFHNDFAELLKETKIETLVVFIDDLDRCLPDTVIETLEAIRLFLYAPQTAFIIGADEKLVEYAVKHRFQDVQSEMPAVGRDYLEKLIQFPVRIPPLGRSELETYINLLFANSSGIDEDKLEEIRQEAIKKSPDQLHQVTFNFEIAKRVLGEVPLELSESLTLAGYLAPILASGLNGNPRQTKRFLNTLMMRIHMAQSREVQLERSVLAKLMLLEYLKPESFKQLAQWQSDQEGRPEELVKLEEVFRDSKEQEKGTGKQTNVGNKGLQANGGSDKQSRDSSAPSPAKLDDGKGHEPDREQSTREKVIDESAKGWVGDPWLEWWLQSEPELSKYDLRPYFFFSRDILGPLGISVRRMSPAAQNILAQLLSESEASRNMAFRKAAGLNDSEAASVFEALVERTRRQEQLSGQGDVLDIAFKWAEARPEMIGQFIILAESLPESILPIVVVPRLVMLTEGSESESISYSLIQRWSKSEENQILAKAAETQLKKKTGL